MLFTQYFASDSLFELSFHKDYLEARDMLCAFLFFLNSLSYLCKKRKSFFILIDKIALRNNLTIFNYSWMDVDKLIYMWGFFVQYKVKLKFPTHFGVKFKRCMKSKSVLGGD